jgi:geranyl-CoA carboxylase alpha subunit
MPAFSKILVANRGEIACRIIEAAHARGYTTIAVYSDADATARHVALADQAVRIGPPAAASSYLSIDALLAAAAASGANAIHPGYGFLSENAEFAAACVAAGLVFIGPPASAISAMGNKAAAKRLMLSAGVPCVPGYQGIAQDDPTLIEQAEAIGFPIMVKAAAGGGGRGMRLVEDRSALSAAIASARSEAASAFGSDELILEKAVIRPRHVEIQVVADDHGNILHLGERDCSVQRRHQKVVEEAPCPVMLPELRTLMGDAAVQAARSIDYRGVGTVEFLVDEKGGFYFLEMNTRIQVEHPVTEMVTGVDLIGLQFDIAAGRPLPMTQDDIKLDGHAIEVRLYAEDPTADFLPQTGQVHLWRRPVGPGLRIDHGLNEGDVVSPFYDPMQAKLIAYGDNREEARRRLIRALGETALLGVATNKAFLIDILRHPEFIAGNATTGFLADHFPAPAPASPQVATMARALAGALLMDRAAPAGDLANWWSTGPARTLITLRSTDRDHKLSLAATARLYAVTDAIGTVDLEFLSLEDHHLSFKVGGQSCTASFAIVGATVHLELEHRNFAFEDVTFQAAAATAENSDGTIRSPMNGIIASVKVDAGSVVKKDTVLMVLEAMKMEHSLKAPAAGIVEDVRVSAGEQVATRQILARLKAHDEVAR